MKLSISQIIDKHRALCEFAEKDIELPAQVAWNIDDNLDAFKRELEKFDSKRNKLINRLIESGAAIVVDDGNRIVAATGREEEFHASELQINELLQVEVNVDVATISESDLPHELTVKDLHSLKFMVLRNQNVNLKE